MLSNTPFLRTGIFLALAFTFSAGLYQLAGHRHGDHHGHHQYDDYQDRQQSIIADETLHNGSVELPLFPGCSEKGDYGERRRCSRVKIGRYLNAHLNKDLLDRKGRVYVGFTVDLAGQLRNARLKEKTDPVLAAEVMRLVGLQQGADLRWTPGKIRGTPRVMNATLQVSFGMRCKGCEHVMVEMVP